MMARHDTGRLELREHPIHGGQPDVLVQVEQTTVDILGAHVPQVLLLARISRILTLGIVIFRPARRSCEVSTVRTSGAARGGAVPV
jgi:hypothetical protein